MSGIDAVIEFVGASLLDKALETVPRGLARIPHLYIVGNIETTRIGAAERMAVGRREAFCLFAPARMPWSRDAYSGTVDAVKSWLRSIVVRPDAGMRDQIERLCSAIQYLVLENQGLRNVLDQALAEVEDLTRRNEALSEWLTSALDANTQLEQLRADVEALSFEAARKVRFDDKAAKDRLVVVGNGLMILLTFVASFGGTAAGQLLPNRSSKVPAAISQEQHESLSVNIGDLVQECIELGTSPQPHEGHR